MDINIKTELFECVLSKNPHFTEEQLERVWGFYTLKTKRIIEILSILRDRHFKDKYRYNSYNQAINNIKQLQTPIFSAKQAQMVRGIGVSITSKIDEILKTDTLTILSGTEEADKKEVIERLMKVWGIGISQAQRFYAVGVRQLADLEKFELTPQQRIGLKYYSQFNQKTPREVIAKVEDSLESILDYVDPLSRFSILGSYRRGLEEVGDLDILISPGKSTQNTPASLIKKYVQKLKDLGYIVDELSLGKQKFMGVIKFDSRILRLDIFSIENENYGAASVYFTGPKEFNLKVLHPAAKRLHFKFSQHGLKERFGNKIISVPTEEDVFKALQLEWLAPTQRG